jgi:hypothetical protein
MVDRLVELLKDSPMLDVLYAEDNEWQIVADYLREQGVIVAPMPMTEELREELTQYVYNRCVEEL